MGQGEAGEEPTHLVEEGVLVGVPFALKVVDLVEWVETVLGVAWVVLEALEVLPLEVFQEYLMVTEKFLAKA